MLIAFELFPGIRCECIGHEVGRSSHYALGSLTHHDRDVGANLRNKTQWSRCPWERTIASSDGSCYRRPEIFGTRARSASTASAMPRTPAIQSSNPLPSWPGAWSVLQKPIAHE